ncbi:YwmB family TATA-box binding protein [Lederbergia sp. NSJ-179]|uniref:YwmB family TATA-box binding protein n=1 Tax=Lederbergia sp. NSJ-179 TaxID=2931402 RepID=UPI001FCFB7FC|nr:YwmB family TATA-box binding protein [Lederbergia sp. NSJ-179]MCJ7840581.1 YwmB family TATA-box binding protein [Lederbergia sp. NSJ-179]
MKSNTLKLVITSAAFIVCLILLFNGNKLSAKTNLTEINDLASSIIKLDGTIIEWSLYAREPVQKELSKEQYTELFPEMEWTLERNSMKGTINYGTYSETIQVITNQHGNAPSFITYELKGSDWSEAAKIEASGFVSRRMNTLFSGEPTLFSCIKGEFNETIDEFTKHSLNDLMQSLQAKEIESVTEKNFQSISAYSSLFSQSLALTNQEMNIQLGLRNSEWDNGTILVIGTPILTIEY